MAGEKVKSPMQIQIEALEAKAAVFDRLISVAKTEGGRITDHGKNLYYILREAGLSKSEIARTLEVTPSALTKYS